MNEITIEEVRNQEQRYFNLLKNTNLKKLGEKISKDEFLGFNLIKRYLKIHGNIHCSMYIPSAKRDIFYGEDLRNKAFDAFFKSLRQ